MANKLTEKQELFAKAYYTIGGTTFGNGQESARVAGYKGNNDVLKNQACENLTKDYITAQKAVIQAKTAKISALSIETVLNQLSKAYRIAETNADVAGMDRTSELQGKYLSMWSERGDNSQEEKAALDANQKREAIKLANYSLMEDVS